MNLSCAVKVGSLLISLLIFPLASTAATLYVEKWGDDDNNCSRSSPCLTINHAKNVSSQNGRIVVGPGIYNENVWINLNGGFEPLSGLKLESTAGRHATFIEAGNASSHAVNIRQSKVRFGKKRRGFTVSGATLNSSAGIYIDGAGISNVRIEGNEARENHDGIVLQGEKIVLIGNLATHNNANGVECFLCSRATIRDNLMQENDINGMLVYFSSQVTIERNVARDNGAGGISTDTTSNTNRLKIRNNVATLNDGNGITAGDVGGGVVQGNISANNGNDGLFVREGQTVRGGKVIGNLLVGNDGPGADFNDTDLSTVRADANTAADNDGPGFLFTQNGATVSSFKSNNSFANQQAGINCGIDNDSVQLLNVVRHFFGGGDVGCGPVDGSTTTRPSALKIRTASGL